MYRAMLLLVLVALAPLADAHARQRSAQIPRRPLAPPPVLLTPQAGAVVDNGCENRTDGTLWSFEWSEVPGATCYHIFVKNRGAKNPVVDDDRVVANAYTKIGRKTYVINKYLTGWTWKVQAKVNGEWGHWSEEREFSVEPLDTDCLETKSSQAERVPEASLAAPELISPAPDTVFDNYPRTTRLTWSAVPGAELYRVEVDYAWGRNKTWASEQAKPSNYVVYVVSPHLTFNFVGAQPGRWRVTPIGGDGKDGPTTEWREFRYVH